jgi:predicted Co/Zn/Cd cation transporter (cation efflux family)
VLAVLIRRGAAVAGSPLVAADAKNWLLNAALSSCVVIAFGSILLMRGTRLEPLAAYVDPAVVLTLVLLTIVVPVRMAWNALMELLNRAPSASVVQEVRRAVEAGTAELPVQERFVRVLQPGRSRMVLAHVVLPADFAPDRLASLDRVRSATLARLQEQHAATMIDLVFTTDRRWGIPGGPGPQAREA